ncbi:M23 family metallopeptidase [Microbacterium sp. LWH7-1.2]|uniref:M23 family metallopeptidase n=1 Tax=Microbacterium sp. LWH7-1.2 TaxID=3135257 RepID=UPI003138C0EE
MTGKRAASRGAPRIAVLLAVVLATTGCTADPTDPEDPSESAPAPSASPTETEAGEPQAGGLDAGTRFTPLMSSLITDPMPVTGTDDKIHVTYELLLTNATTLPFRLDGLEVVDPESEATLLVEDDERLPQTVTRLGASAGGEPGSGSVLIDPAETWIAWLDVQLDADAAVPATLEHRAQGAVVVPEGEPREFDVVIGTTPVDAGPATAVGVPVADGIWMMSEGCCRDDTHHRRGFAPVNGQGLVPQRFAIDFYLLDEEHRTWEGDPSQITSYFSYRQPIVAAAAGTVVRALDGLPNTTALPEPPPIPPIEETVGNHVVIEIAPGLYALYGHMDPGSVRVEVGDRVEKGQELGLIGSSGNSTTPHLHFHLQTAETFFPSDGVPYVFDEFELLGWVPERIWDDDLGLQPTGVLPFEEFEPSVRRAELPLDRTVIAVDQSE